MLERQIRVMTEIRDTVPTAYRMFGFMSRRSRPPKLLQRRRTRSTSRFQWTCSAILARTVQLAALASAEPGCLLQGNYRCRCHQWAAAFRRPHPRARHPRPRSARTLRRTTPTRARQRWWPTPLSGSAWWIASGRRYAPCTRPRSRSVPASTFGGSPTTEASRCFSRAFSFVNGSKLMKISCINYTTSIPWSHADIWYEYFTCRIRVHTDLWFCAQVEVAAMSSPAIYYCARFKSGWKGSHCVSSLFVKFEIMYL